MDAVRLQAAQEVVEVAQGLSAAAGTGLPPAALAVVVALLDQGVSPDALATRVRE